MTGKQIRMKRLGLEMSQWDIANRIGVTQAVISYAERGGIVAEKTRLAIIHTLEEAEANTTKAEHKEIIAA